MIQHLGRLRLLYEGQGFNKSLMLSAPPMEVLEKNLMEATHYNGHLQLKIDKVWRPKAKWFVDVVAPQDEIFNKETYRLPTVRDYLTLST